MPIKIKVSLTFYIIIVSAAVIFFEFFFGNPNLIYILLFLAFFGSVLGFSFYLSLLGKIGADKASYVNILTPVVALSLSTLFENYLWNIQNFLGLLLIIIGNVIILSKKLR